MIASYALKNRAVTLVLIFLILAGGLISFDRMGRLEDPEFTIKEALVITNYPGATPYEVEEEVSDELERAVQKLGKIKKIESRNIPGQSTITVEMRSTVPGEALPQVWDELRRKINDAQGSLPPGAGPTSPRAAASRRRTRDRAGATGADRPGPPPRGRG